MISSRNSSWALRIVPSENKLHPDLDRKHKYYTNYDWDRLPEEVLESPSLEIFKSLLEKHLDEMV